MSHTYRLEVDAYTGKPTVDRLIPGAVNACAPFDWRTDERGLHARVVHQIAGATTIGWLVTKIAEIVFVMVNARAPLDLSIRAYDLEGNQDSPCASIETHLP
jgi:hypothetical protein